MPALYKLYGMPLSLYTGKVRSYLRKQGINYTEHAAGTAHFREVIAAKMGRWIIPVIETPDGDLLQDGTDIIDHFEAQGDRRMPTMPDDPVMQAAAHLFEFYGGEGMLRPAMHYRWNFNDDNMPFIKHEFCVGMTPQEAAAMGDQFFEAASSRMKGAMGFFGVSDQSIPTIEAAYKEFLTLFDDHLQHGPYLLGGMPSRGDYGLIAPLYAHLGRDPNPSSLMKKIAPRVWRWVERMNACDHSASDYPNYDPGYYSGDTVPETLGRLMAFVAEDYLPEITAHVGFANQWLAAHPGIKEGTLGLKDPGERIIGKAKFNWRGIELETAVMPYRFYMLQRLTDAVDGMDAAAQAAVRTMFAKAGLEAMLDLKTDRRVERQNHLEYWGA
jgi:glutathione S-transferase